MREPIARTKNVSSRWLKKCKSKGLECPALSGRLPRILLGGEDVRGSGRIER